MNSPARNVTPPLATAQPRACSALAASYRHLDQLRYDFPLLLCAGGGLRTLRDLMNDTLSHIAPRGTPGEALRRRGLALETELRRLSLAQPPQTLSGQLDRAMHTLAAASLDHSELAADLARIRAAVDGDGLLSDCGPDCAVAVLRHLWLSVFAQRMREMRTRIDRRAQQLADLLRAAELASPAGRQADALRRALPGRLGASINTSTLSGMLDTTNQRGEIPPARRTRIEAVLATLRGQRLFARTPDLVASRWQFASCSEAAAAFAARLPELVALLRAMRIAELELAHRYHESLHDAYFADFGEDDVSPEDFESLPALLVYVRNPEVAEQGAILQALDTSLPVKILVQHDDILSELPLAAGKFSLGTHGGQLGRVALGVEGAYVAQLGCAQLVRNADWIQDGLEGSVPALFNVYAGLVEGAAAPYLLSAAAAEARSFPAFRRDPRRPVVPGDALGLSRNPQATEDWPAYPLVTENTNQQRNTLMLRFSFADFASLDPRYARHFAPIDTARAAFTPVDQWLKQPDQEMAATIRLARPDGRVQVCAVDDALLRASRRCLESWHSLQALNCPAGLALATLNEAAPEPPAECAESPASPVNDAPGGAYIETPRCTTCEECVQINARMFAYDANKQAYIADRHAGSFRELVEAAESCQVSIIHPGEPLDPDEPGLDELRARAQLFL